MNKVVVISGHPDLEKSYTNKVILDELATQVDSIDVRRLDTMYPDYQIDVEAEQKALLNADAIVFQFPYYWYSVPALLKKWIDDVFAFNFAFGPEGDKLKGKQFILSITVGGPEESYGPLGVQPLHHRTNPAPAATVGLPGTDKLPEAGLYPRHGLHPGCL